MGFFSFLLITCVLETNCVDKPVRKDKLSVVESVIVLVWEFFQDFLAQDCDVKSILAKVIQVGVSRFTTVEAALVPMIRVGLHDEPGSVRNV